MAGNSKKSSPSDIAYFARRKATMRDTINKNNRIARHIRRMGISQQKLSEAGGLQSAPRYGRPAREFSPDRTVFKEPIRADWQGAFLHQVIVDGVLVEQSPRESDAINAINATFSRLPYKHVLLNPLTGERSLLSSRNRS